MRNKIQEGKIIEFEAMKNHKSGDLVVINDFIGIAVGDFFKGKKGQMDTEGVYELPKVNNDNIGFGQKVYASSSGEITLSTEKTVFVGYAVENAIKGSPFIKVKLKN
jgi:predicted RecA/RadA family phage recombinase